ncbi:tumor necrosis factor ligand superfamily member 18 isoform X2 [Pseudorasbora parva]|uniref:tumor necrosis factor ligand superfamily member 18 isoform X2 n=1 Tax=Pseudorasbora parva TaxID=51549 RepID=UPI00351E054E
MSLSAECCSDKTGDRGGGGGALAQQRRLIRGLLVWATLLTLGLITSITLHCIHRESPAPDLQDSRNLSQPQQYMDINLMSFSPNWSEKEMVELLQWKTVDLSFINITEQLNVKTEGLYFLYLQVTLDPRMKGNYTITLQSNNRNVILKGLLNESKHSTGFMGKGIMLNSKESLNVTCKPKAKIWTNETYLGVIKLR